jgi:hypothetical protein
MVRAPMQAPDLLDWNVATQQWTGLLVEWQSRAKAIGYPINYLIVEKNVAQRFLLQYEWFNQWCRMNSITIRPHQTTQNKADDEFGIPVLKSHYKFGRVRLPGTQEARKVMEPLVKELTHYPDVTTTDCVMANWFLEYQLQFLVRNVQELPSVYNDISTWLNKSVSYA